MATDEQGEAYDQAYWAWHKVNTEFGEECYKVLTSRSGDPAKLEQLTKELVRTHAEMMEKAKPLMTWRPAR